MSFYTASTIKAMRALNSSGPQSDPRSIPAYRGPVANNSFDSSSPEPSSPTSHTSPRIPLRSRTKGESSIEEDADVGSRVDRGGGSSAGMMRNLPQERSRFASVQRRTEGSTNARVSQIPAVHPRQPSAGRSLVPAPIKATPATVSRVVGPRPFRSQRTFHARREPTLAVPKAVHPLPEWLTDFEDDEEEPSLSTSTIFTTTGVEPHSDRIFKRPPLSMAPPLRFSDPGYTGALIEARADRSLTEMEEGLGFTSKPASGSTLDSFEGEGVELSAVVISPRSPVF